MQGFLILNKPQDFTSHDCVAIVRRTLKTKKVGHGGTLDPLATGVLPIAVGRATRLLQYLSEGKSYRAVVRFGLTTTTDDLEGTILTHPTAPHLRPDQIQMALGQFQGTIDQIPPSYSAVQVAGKRLYELARQGKAVEAPVRQVKVHSIRLADWQAGACPEATLDIHCGPGTYIRSIARDLGTALGPGATLAGLKRTHSSGFDLSQSITLDTLAAQAQAGDLALIPPEQGIQHLKTLSLDAETAKRWRQGQKIAAPPRSQPHYPYRVLDGSNHRFIGMGQVEYRDGQWMLVAKFVFAPWA